MRAPMIERVVISDFDRPSAVIVNGKLVAQDNKPLFTNTDQVPDFALNTIHINPIFHLASSFKVQPKEGHSSAWIQAMEMYDGYFKRAFHAQLSVSPSGSIESDIRRDILKVVVIDRHHATKNRGIAFVKGFGLQKGAIACTTNCENQNLVVIGTSDVEIAGAVQAIEKLGGGFVAVLDGEVLGSVKLDVAGCMSSEPWEKVRDNSVDCDKAAREVLGCGIKSPFMIMSFIGLVSRKSLSFTKYWSGVPRPVCSQTIAQELANARTGGRTRPRIDRTRFGGLQDTRIDGRGAY